MIVCELESAESYVRIGWLALALGVLFLAYDLLAYFAPTAILILLFRRKWPHAMLAGVLILIPSFINKAALLHAGWDPRNENTRVYDLIVNAYLHPPATLGAWWHHIKDTPWSMVRVFFTSNFIILPALFLIVAGVNFASYERVRIRPAVRWVLLVGLGLFLFINLAPAYKGWQFRGVGLARIYQPIFGVMMVFILQVIERVRLPMSRAQALSGCGIAAAVLNSAIVFGPVTKNPAAAWVYWRFYMHAPRPMMIDNLKLFGRRPLGFCNRKIKIQNPPPRILGAGRPKKIPLAQRPPKHKRATTTTAAKPLTKAQKARLKANAKATAPSARAIFAAPCRDG
jgi:hypothetical protein